MPTCRIPCFQSHRNEKRRPSTKGQAMRFRVHGADRENGVETSIDVEAKDVATATAIANERYGMVVDSVEPVSLGDAARTPAMAGKSAADTSLKTEMYDNPFAFLAEPGQVMAFVGWIVVIAGAIWMGCALAMKTTVYTFGSPDVHNLGLMNDRMVHTIIAGAVFLAGIVFVAAGSVIRCLRSTV